MHNIIKTHIDRLGLTRLRDHAYKLEQELLRINLLSHADKIPILMETDNYKKEYEYVISRIQHLSMRD